MYIPCSDCMQQHDLARPNCSTLGTGTATMKLYKTTAGFVLEDEAGLLHLANASTVPPPPACPPVDWDHCGRTATICMLS